MRTQYGVSKLKENKPISFFGVNDSKESTITFVRILNEQHRNGNTGQVFKMIELTNPI